MLIPVVVIGVIAALAMAGGSRDRRDRRYRPGRPYDFQPIWFLSTPERVTGGGHQAAIEAAPVLEDSTGARVKAGSVGGASDSW